MEREKRRKQNKVYTELAVNYSFWKTIKTIESVNHIPSFYSPYLDVSRSETEKLEGKKKG